jgi:ubiquinone/menaquinone biosynthesis C-methylase UbiE
MTDASPLDTSGVREAMRREWTEAAPGWRKWRAQFALQSRAVTELLLQAAHLRPGATVLDLASGSGEPAISLAEEVNATGHVVATDLVPAMLLGLHDVISSVKFHNLWIVGAEADSLPFANATFDCATCRLGLMFFPNPESAMGEIRRVLRPGGRAVFAVWGEAARNTFQTVTTGVLKRFAAPPAGSGAPDVFKFAERGSVSSVFERAGFLSIEEQHHEIPWIWPGTPETFWEFNTEMRVSFRKLFEGLSPGQREAAKREVLAEVARYHDGRQINLRAYVVIGSAMRPAEDDAG